MTFDLGLGYSARWIGWHPDRSIPANAERYATVPDIEKMLLLVACPHGEGGIHVDRPGIRELVGDYVWTIEQEEPLTLSPSILRTECGCHGFIRDGRWFPA